MSDDVDTLRTLYRYLRQHRSPIMRGRAYRLFKRWEDGNAATFIASPNGDVVALPCARAALIAELRLVLIRAGYPIDWMARFDRTDIA